MKLENITDTKRRYDDACGAAHALELVGERWALLVIRELMMGPKRFTDLRADLPGISANVLTQRLEGLEGAGVLVKRKLPAPAPAQVYELTPWGYESEPIFQVLGRWAARSPRHDSTLPLSAVSILLSFRTMFDPAKAEGVAMAIGLRLGRENYVVRIADSVLTAQRGDVAGTDFVLTGPPPLIAAAVYGKVPFAALAESGLTLEGDRDAADRFVSFFALPPKAEG